MSGGWKQAKLAGRRPLDGGVSGRLHQRLGGHIASDSRTGKIGFEKSTALGLGAGLSYQVTPTNSRPGATSSNLVVPGYGVNRSSTSVPTRNSKDDFDRSVPPLRIAHIREIVCGKLQAIVGGGRSTRKIDSSCVRRTSTKVSRTMFPSPKDIGSWSGANCAHETSKIARALRQERLGTYETANV